MTANSSSTGWRCPGCLACYNPSVTECQRCAPLPVTPAPVSPFVPWVSPTRWLAPNAVPCLFDYLPDGVYGLVCPCPRHTPQFTITTTHVAGEPYAFTDARGFVTDDTIRVGHVAGLSS